MEPATFPGPVSARLIVPLLLALSAAGSCAPGDDPAPLDLAGERPAAAESWAPASAATLFPDLVQRARALSREPFHPPDTLLPGHLATLDYEGYRAIEFRREAALWQGETPFHLHLFHRGFLYRAPVGIHLVEGGSITSLPFDPGLFLYRGDTDGVADGAPADLGWAGFRILYPLNREDHHDEVAVFLGASYFRLLGPGQVHGLSARGVAVNTVAEGGEEFPAFRDFWVEKPEAAGRTLRFHALLDGPSVTGAYRFALEPGRMPGAEEPSPTVLEVEAHLFAREDVARLGLAPLTSMFLHDALRPYPFDDFRPRVHDSEGLLARTGAGEWIWRPLSNGPGLRVTSLMDRNPAGFGLVQRDRNFSSYMDLEAQYHRRPSLWVQVGDGDWGSGAVQLVEIPTDSEFHDNIVAYWTPDRPFRAGEERILRYRLLTFDDRLPEQEVARVVRTRVAWDALPGEAAPPPRSRRRVVVDFAGGAPPPPAGSARVQAVLEHSTGEPSTPVVLPLPGGEGWRATFHLEPEGESPVDLRLFLALDGSPLTETWSYLWDPRAIP